MLISDVTRRPKVEPVGAGARHRSPYSIRVRALRVVWTIVYAVAFRPSPRPLWRWRNWLLRMLGARVAATARIHPTVKVVLPWNLAVGENTSVGDSAILYGLGPIRLGARVTISQYAHLCAGTHDYRNPDMPLITEHILIANDVWVAADAFIGPGVTVGAGAVVGARAVVVKDVRPWTVVGGNPAVFLKARKLTREA